MKIKQVLDALTEIQKTLNEQKKLSEGGFYESHDLLFVARKQVAELIKEVAAVTL